MKALLHGGEKKKGQVVMVYLANIAYCEINHQFKSSRPKITFQLKLKSFILTCLDGKSKTSLFLIKIVSPVTMFARNLFPCNTYGSDTYVRIYLLPDQKWKNRMRTKVKRKTVNPAFDEK